MKIESTNPYNKTEILDTFREVNHQLVSDFTVLSPEQFFAPQNGHWSPAQNLVHLIKSARPVTKALKMPRMVLSMTFGRADRPSRTFKVMHATYLQVLAEGLQAPQKFRPDERELPADLAAGQQDLLEKWQAEFHRLQSCIEDL